MLQPYLRKRAYILLSSSVFSLEFNEQTWTCHFLLFYFCWTIHSVLHKVMITVSLPFARAHRS